MFYYEPSFDWYQCTVFTSDVSPDSVSCLGCFCPEDVTFPLDYFEAVERIALAYGGDVDIKSVPARNGWLYAVQLCHGSRVYCTISMKNSSSVKNCFNVQWSGSDSQGGSEIARRLFPGHSVTRCDVALDCCFSSSQGLKIDTGVVLAGCVDIAVDHRLSTTMLGDWSGRDQSGRTLYIGSCKSPLRCRVYEKGRQPDSQPADPDWLRFELVYRPKGQVLRRAASTLRPVDFIASFPAFSEIVRTYYSHIDESVSVLLTEIVDRHSTDTDRALSHMFKQYRKCMIKKATEYDTNHDFCDWFLGMLYPDEHAPEIAPDRLQVPFIDSDCED